MSIAISVALSLSLLLEKKTCNRQSAKIVFRHTDQGNLPQNEVVSSSTKSLARSAGQFVEDLELHEVTEVHTQQEAARLSLNCLTVSIAKG